MSKCISRHLKIGVLSIVFGSVTSSGGVVIKGGGDLLECRDTIDPTKTKLWMLDRFLTQGSRDYGGCEYHDKMSIDDSVKLIVGLLDSTYPAVSADFKEFAKSAIERSDSTRRIWQRSPSKLKSINTDDIDREIPLECSIDIDGKTVANLHQVVVRRQSDKPHVIFYEYDESLMNRINSLELSYLIVHEWLRDFTIDAWSIRNVNRFLHSCSVLDMSQEKFVKVIESMGVDLSKPLGVRKSIAACIENRPIDTEHTWCQDWDSIDNESKLKIEKQCMSNKGQVVFNKRCNYEYFSNGNICSYKQSLTVENVVTSKVFDRSNWSDSSSAFRSCTTQGGEVDEIPPAPAPPVRYISPLRD